MSAVLPAFGALRDILQVVLLWTAVAVAVVATVDWLVRTRRLNPFGPVARFMRRHVDPLMAPVERRVLRAGGLPSSAPWWTLVAVIVGGILLLTLVDFLRGLVADLSQGVAGGPVGLARLALYWTFTLLRIAIIVRVIASWLPVSTLSPWIRWAFTLSEPMLRPLRRLIPPFGSIDITPIIAFFGLGIIEALLRGMLG